MTTRFFSRDDTRRLLAAQGVGAEAIEKVIKQRYDDEPTEDTTDAAGDVAHAAPVVPALVLPFRLILPWSALCSDNFKSTASLVRVDSGKVAPRNVLTARYRAAFDKTRAIARDAIGERLPVGEPLALTALVFVPNTGLHDVCNFQKCCHDALAKVVYTDDRWLYRATWERAGVDVDRPRAELLITCYL